MSQVYEESTDEAYNEMYRLGSLSMPAFESASTSYRQEQRAAYLADADELAVSELTLIQSRSRDVSRNNPITYAAESKFVVKLGSVKVNWKTSTGNKHEVMQDLWDEFAANPNIDGFGDLNVTQSLWNHDRFQSGEAISRMLLVTRDNSNRIKLKLQNIESEYLPISYRGSTMADMNNTRYGITFVNNKPSVYNFYPERYYGIPDASNMFNYVQIDAEDILHIFERRRSNQWRGIPIVAPILNTLYELTDLTQATVSKQKSAAAISWIIEQANAVDINAIGSVRTAGKDSISDPVQKIFFAANGGSVQYTNPGDRFNLVQSSDIGANLMGLIKHELQTIAASYGIPYYMLSSDTSGLDFSSIRGILIEFRNYLEFIHHVINIPSGLAKLTKRFKAIAQFSYEVSDAVPTYQMPRNYGVDELKDAQADLLELQLGATTIERIQEERGVTSEEVIASRKKMQADGMGDILVATPTNANQNTNVKGNANTTGS